MSRKLTSKERAEMNEMFEPGQLVPASFGERVKEFISDNKKKIIAAFCFVAVLVGIYIFISASGDPDVRILFVSSDYVLPESTAANLEDLLLRYTPDIQGDTARYPQVTVGYYNADGGELSEEKAAAEKAFREALANPDIYVIFADETTWNYLKSSGYTCTNEEAGAGAGLADGNAHGVVISETKIFAFVPTSPWAIQMSDYDHGLTAFLADYHVVFKAYTPVDDEELSEEVLKQAAAKSFFAGVVATATSYSEEVSE